LDYSAERHEFLVSFNFEWWDAAKTIFFLGHFPIINEYPHLLRNFIYIAWLLLLLPFIDENFIYLNIVSEMDMCIFMPHTKCNQWMGDSCLRITQFAIAIKKIFSAISNGNIHIHACGRRKIFRWFLFWVVMNVKSHFEFFMIFYGYVWYFWNVQDKVYFNFNWNVWVALIVFCRFFLWFCIQKCIFESKFLHFKAKFQTFFSIVRQLLNSIQIQIRI